MTRRSGYGIVKPEGEREKRKEEKTVAKTYACANCKEVFKEGTPGTSCVKGFKENEIIALCARCESRAQKGGRVSRVIARSILARGGYAWLKNSIGEFFYHLDFNGSLLRMYPAYSSAVHVRVSDLDAGRIEYSGLPSTSNTKS